MANKREKKTTDIQKKLEEAKKMRLEALAKAEKSVAKNEKDYKEEFEDFWAKNKKAYGKDKSLQNVIWVHLKAIKCDKPEKFEEGIENFGLKKLKGDK